MKTQQDMPTNVEQEIDTALKMLGQTQPPAGLTARVHRGLITAFASKQARQGWLVWITVAGAATAILFAVGLEFHIARGKPTGIVESAKISAPDSVQPRQDSQLTLVSTRIAHDRTTSTQPATHRYRKRKSDTQRDAANLFNYPLTRQEKLLVQFALHAKPEDLRDLNPEYQAQMEAQQEAEFAAYVKSGSSSGTTAATQNTQE